MSKDQIVTFIIATLELDSTSVRQDQIENVGALIDQYAYEYAERVIGNNPAPIVCSCDAPAVAMCICTAKFGNDLRAAQRKLNKKLSSHKEEERKER